jgi:hypothetical protein
MSRIKQNKAWSPVQYLSHGKYHKVYKPDLFIFLCGIFISK